MIKFIALASLYVASAMAGCEDWAGATGSLSTLGHQVAGTVVVKGDCSIQIDDFSWDGGGPDVLLWGVKGSGNIREGNELGAILPKRRFTSECYSHKLQGMDFDQLSEGEESVILSIWCKQVSANFGQVTLTKPSTPTANAKPATCDAGDGCSEWIGATGALSTLGHAVSGTIEIMAGCTVRINNFNYDGTGPDVFLYGTTGDGNLETGSNLGEIEMRAFNDECLAHEIGDNTFGELAGSGDTVKLSIWCRQFNANFGEVVLTRPATPGTSEAEASCTAASCGAWVGATADLVTEGHAVSGTLKVMQDCTIAIDNFGYDGLGPDVFWYVSKTGEDATKGVKFGEVPMRAFDNECIVANLAAGANDLGSIAGSGDSVDVHVWCEQFSSRFAVATLKKPATPDATITTTATCGNCPSTNPNCLNNCVQVDKHFNVWWQIRGDEIEIELEADIAENDWAGFGIADQENYGMVGADVTIAGFVDGIAEAADYFLTAQSQCNYNAGADSGVCPDGGITTCPNAEGAKGKSDVTLLSAERVGTVTRVRYSRKLDTQDPCDRPFVKDSGKTRVIWAVGPITDAGGLIVNTHATGHVEGSAGHSPSDGPSTEFDFFRTPVIDEKCRQLPKRTTTDQEEEFTGFCVDLIEEETEFTCVIENHGPNEYPNPPAWGVSWEINGKKTPELVVRRGTEYTFKVGGTDQHPFYIVDNDKGGQAVAEEVVFAGSVDVWGTPEAPKELKWTPDASTPDLVYYQCVTHQKLGWIIHVVDADQFLTALPEKSSVCDESMLRKMDTTSGSLLSVALTATLFAIVSLL